MLPCVVGQGCVSDADCTGEAWKCGKALAGEEAKPCGLPSDEGEGATSKCACFAPVCSPVEVDGNTTKTKVLFIGDQKMALLSESFGIRYSNSYSTYAASREVGMNARWALRCAPTWLQNPVFDYVVVQLGRMDSSSASAVSSDLDTYRKTYRDLVDVLNAKGGKAKIVLLPIMPMYKEAKVPHWDYDRLMKYNKVLGEDLNLVANICPILDKDHFGSPKLCGKEDWDDVCHVHDTDQVYPQDTMLQHDEEGLALDLAFGFSSKEGDMLTLTFINKCLLYAQALDTVTKGNLEVKAPDVPVHFTYHSNRNVIWVRKRVRIRVRVRVRRRIRIRVRRYVRVRRRVRVRYYW